MKIKEITGMLLLMVSILGCEKDNNPPVEMLSVLAILVDGSNLIDGAENIPTNASLSLSFSGSLDPSAFETQLSLNSAQGAETLNVVYTNSSAKATIDLMLLPGTAYNLRVNAGVIGENGEQLDEEVKIAFNTQQNEVITALPPCTSTPQCLQSVMLDGSLGRGKFEFYSNYPIYEENAVWEDLTQAVIVVHGASVNPDDYFSYLTNTLNALSLSENTVLVSPFFRRDAANSSDDFHWSSLSYRDGRLSSNPNKISSFEVVDSLIAQLADKDHFPQLDQIIITGQSSGGRFTHVYAPANQAEFDHTDIRFEYIVSESQYFYYPDGQRIDENTNNLYTPTGCVGYDIWTFGYNVVPAYLSNVSVNDFNQEFVNRDITYLLGSGSGTDSSLNTDCSAMLLGSSRYQRGENMFRYMELVYPNIHNHSKVVVPGVAHNGSEIYQSSEFRLLLSDLLK